MQCYVK